MPQDPRKDTLRTILGGLKNLVGSSPTELPDTPLTPPQSPPIPAGFQARPVGDPNIPSFDPSSTQVGDGIEGGARPSGITGDMKNAPQVLEGLRSAGGINDPSTKLFGIQSKLRDEIAGNLAKAHGAGRTFMTGATSQDLSDIDRDLAENPVSQYQGQKLETQHRQYEAGMGGFKSPQEAAMFGRNLETQRVGSPLEVAKQQGVNSINTVQEQNKGAQNKFELLQDLLSRGAIAPGSQFSLGSGVSMRSGQALPGSAGRPLADELTKKIKARNDLNNPGAWDWLQNQGASFGVPGMHSTQERGANMDNEIRTLQGQLGGQGQNPARQHAIDELTRAGYPISEENIQEVIRQLTGQ